jgi:hypothetical protein
VSSAEHAGSQLEDGANHGNGLRVEVSRDFENERGRRGDGGLVSFADVGLRKKTVELRQGNDPGSADRRPPRTVAPTTIAALTRTMFLMMY